MVLKGEYDSSLPSYVYEGQVVDVKFNGKVERFYVKNKFKGAEGKRGELHEIDCDKFGVSFYESLTSSSSAKSFTTSTTNNNTCAIKPFALDTQISQILALIEPSLFPPQATADGQPSSSYATSALKPLKGVLIHGPTGTAKTMLSRYVGNRVNEVDCVEYVFLDCSTLISTVSGYGERVLKGMFDRAMKLEYLPSFTGEKKAKAKATLVVLDNIDAICKSRADAGVRDGVNTSRICGMLLALMDSTTGSSTVPSNPLVFLATTSTPNSLDPAIRRPGRFDVEIAIPSPNIRNLKVRCFAF